MTSDCRRVEPVHVRGHLRPVGHQVDGCFEAEPAAGQHHDGDSHEGIPGGAEGASHPEHCRENIPGCQREAIDVLIRPDLVACRAWSHRERAALPHLFALPEASVTGARCTVSPWTRASAVPTGPAAGPAAGCSYCDADGSRAPCISGARWTQSWKARSRARSRSYRPHARRRRVHPLLPGVFEHERAGGRRCAVSTTSGLALALIPGPERGHPARLPGRAKGRPPRLVRGEGPGGVGGARAAVRKRRDPASASAGVTPRRISSGHSRSCRSRRLKIAVHLIFGLPGEGLREIMETMGVLARLRPDGVKIHNLHVPAGTVLAPRVPEGRAHGSVAAAAPRVRHCRHRAASAGHGHHASHVRHAGREAGRAAQFLAEGRGFSPRCRRR